MNSYQWVGYVLPSSRKAWCNFLTASTFTQDIGEATDVSRGGIIARMCRWLAFELIFPLISPPSNKPFSTVCALSQVHSHTSSWFNSLNSSLICLQFLRCPKLYQFFTSTLQYAITTALQKKPSSATGGPLATATAEKPKWIARGHAPFPPPPRVLPLLLLHFRLPSPS